MNNQFSVHVPIEEGYAISSVHKSVYYYEREVRIKRERQRESK